MKEFSIKTLALKEEILDAMQSTADSFFDQSKNNEHDINTLASKYHKFGVVFGALQGDRIVGFIAFYCNDPVTRQAYLSMINVKRGSQDSGVGSALMNEMIQYCKEHAFKSIRLEVDRSNAKALAFYKKRGFQLHDAASEHTDYYVLAL